MNLADKVLYLTKARILSIAEVIFPPISITTPNCQLLQVTLHRCSHTFVLMLVPLTPSLPPPQDPAIERLQERIEMETKIKDGATRLLQASSTAALSMEASKGMFVSNAKILALLREIQQLRAGKQSPATNNSSGLKSCPAKLAISGLCVFSHSPQ